MSILGWIRGSAYGFFRWSNPVFLGGRIHNLENNPTLFPCKNVLRAWCRVTQGYIGSCRPFPLITIDRPPLEPFHFTEKKKFSGEKISCEVIFILDFDLYSFLLRIYWI